jgi:predicted regulator of Ras-like GTPase activity (Roadblock/LC7/MglB family)
MNPAQAASVIEGLVQAVPAACRVILTDSQGTLLARADGEYPAGDDALAREYADPLQQVRTLAAELNWGPAQRFSLRGERGRVVFALLPSGLSLGIEVGPSGLCGQMREEAARAAAVLRRG